MKKIKISAVSYLNTKPFVNGLIHSDIFNKIDLFLDMPSLCASKLKDNLVDIGLVPVAVIPEIKGAQIITDYCIAASGKVRTVILASQVPLPEIKTIILDYQSRTSIQLVQILAEFYWHISPLWVKGKPGYIHREIKDTTAAVIIGDRVFEAEKEFAFIYDLGAAWKEMTGLDFVFACWVANKWIDPEFISEFNAALLYGELHIPEVIRENESNYPGCNLDDYFRENIVFHFDDSKRKGLELFLKYNEKSGLK